MYKIEDIALEEDVNIRERKRVWPFGELRKGQSFLVTDKSLFAKAKNAASQYQHRKCVKMAWRTEGENLRIFRI